LSKVDLNNLLVYRAHIYTFITDLTPPPDFTIQNTSTAVQLSDIVTSSYYDLSLHPRIVSNRGTIVPVDSWNLSIVFSLSIALTVATSNLVFGFAAFADKRLWNAVAVRVAGAVGIALLSFLAEKEWILWGAAIVLLLTLGMEGLLKIKLTGKKIAPIPNDSIGGGGVFRAMEAYDIE
jgi:hypothetical protein